MSKKKTSLTSFINTRISIIYLIVLAISIPLIYYISLAQLEKEADAEVIRLSAILKQMSPDILSRKITQDEYPVDAGIAKFLVINDNYHYRFVSVDAAPSNAKFSEHNQKLISNFLAPSAPDEINGTLSSGNVKLVYKAFVVKTTDEVEGFVLFGVKIDSFSDVTIIRVLTFVGLMTILYAVIISSINTTLRSHVINPLLRINNRTKAVANGEIEKVFESKRTDEIGQLIKSIELLRRSLSISMNLHKKNARK